MKILVGVDVGGTFTDVVRLDESTGNIKVTKISSTPADPSRAVLDGIQVVDSKSELQVLHGTTVATNVALQRTGARVGLITTRGFRDVLELRRRERRNTYGLESPFRPLVPRHLRLEVGERTSADGTILAEVDETELVDVVKRLRSENVEVVVIAFINSHQNPANELRARSIVERIDPSLSVVVSSELLPEAREFERTSTAVVNAYVLPSINRYLAAIENEIQRRRPGSRLLVVQSNGGTMSVESVCQAAARTMLSGPAAGVVAAAAIATEAGFRNAISFDVGGTSTDVAIIVNGSPLYTSTFEVDFGIPLSLPMIDISTIGAGGGSIAWIDGTGVLQVGPVSAGASPGPACYGLGGEKPTVTDANVVLGRIDPHRPVGSDRPMLQAELAARAVQREISSPLSMTEVEGAHAIAEIAASKMAANIRKETIQRGYDPKEFALVAYGGAGPLCGAAILRHLGFGCLLIPCLPGLTAALGCLFTDVRIDFAKALFCAFDELKAHEFKSMIDTFIVEGKRRVHEQNVPIDSIEIEVSADMGYEGQTHSIRPRMKCEETGDASRESLLRAFDLLYVQLYGATFEPARVRIENLRVTVVGKRPKFSSKIFARLRERPTSTVPLGYRDVMFGQRYRCPVYERTQLPVHTTIEGPAIIEQDDTTTVVEPDMVMYVDDFSNLIIRARR